MARLWRSESSLGPLVAALLLSCSIVKDSDVQSLADVGQLRITALEIKEQVQQQSPKTTKVSLLYGSDGKISQFNFPSFAGSKFSFRSPTITGSVVGQLSYTAGKISEFDIRAGSESKEKYLFEYDGSGNLFKLTSIGTFPGDVVQTVDSIIYESKQLAKVFRTSTTSTGGKSKVTYTAAYNTSDGTLKTFGQSPTGDIIQIDRNSNQGGDCFENASQHECVAYKTPVSSAQITIRHRFVGMRLEVVMMGENYSIGVKNSDKYVFHPLMVLREEINNSEALMMFYMLDWWVERYPLTGGGGGTFEREFVSLNFLFGT